MFFKYKPITANTSAIWQHAAHTTKEPYQKAYLLEKNIEDLGKKSGEGARGRNKDKTEREKGVVGRRRREETVMWNQMTALRFQSRERHQTSPAFLWGCTFWGSR